MFTRAVEWLFGGTFTGILSGYRAFSRAFVQSFPTAGRGFEIETELTVHALTLNLPVQEIDTPYKSRPEGSVGKLHTYRDGWKNLADDPPAVPHGAPAVVLHAHRVFSAGRVDRPHHSRRTGVHRNRPGPAVSHRHSLHRHRDLRAAQLCLRPDSRYSHSGSSRSQDAGLSGRPPAGNAGRAAKQPAAAATR